MAKEWADVVIDESERTHATMGDEEARLRKAVEDARAELNVARDTSDNSDWFGFHNNKRWLELCQEAYDDAVFALNDAGYEE